MDIYSALMAFTAAAVILTITPGLDTALVLRTAAVEGPRPAFAAGAGVCLGSLTWGVITALGLGALLAVSETAYTILKIAGAAYLFYLGGKLLIAAFRPSPAPIQDIGLPVRKSGWFRRGLLTNLLNPKVGAFYVSFMPQFIPAGASVFGMSVAMAAIHAVLGLIWFAILIAATHPMANFLRRPQVTRAFDGLTGAILVAFGVRLLFDRRS